MSLISEYRDPIDHRDLIGQWPSGKLHWLTRAGKKLGF